jgi:hypothetical protein
MNAHGDDEKTGTYAYPPCFMHEVDQVDPQQQVDVLRWRKAERERLLKERLAIPSDVRRRHGNLIAGHLQQIIGGHPDECSCNGRRRDFNNVMSWLPRFSLVKIGESTDYRRLAQSRMRPCQFLAQT